MMFKVIQYLVGNLLYFISFIVPKSKNKWIFGAWGGDQYADNPKYLFEYVTKYQSEIDPVWLTDNIEVLENLRNRGREVYLKKSFRGFWASCRASVGVISHGMIDINRFACSRLKIIQTWHGIPMKPILLSDPKAITINKRNLLNRLSFIFPFLSKDLDHHKNLVICSSSEYVSNILHKAFGAESNIKITGFPRLDGLFNKRDKIWTEKKMLFNLLNSYKEEGVEIGIYMPTWRRQGEFNIIKYFSDNIESINKHLNDINGALFLRIHPFDQFNIPDLSEFNRIHIIENEDIHGDIYCVLGEFNFLVSDYSSVIFDYSILNKPIFLLVPDRKDYVKSNGDFVYDYQETNLPQYQNWDDLLENLNSYDQNRSKELSEIYHMHNDGKSSERLYKYIIDNK